MNQLQVIGQAEVPPDSRNYRQEFRDYREAVEEVVADHDKWEYNGDPHREPNYYQAAKAKAKAQGAKVL